MSAQNYLDKYGYFSRLIKEPIDERCELILVIPCYKEHSILPTLKSLNASKQSKFSTEVIIVFNSSEEDGIEVTELNLACLKEAKEWSSQNSNAQLTIQYIEAFKLPSKIAGVGMARKIGMDEAVLRFSDLNKDGIIVGFDADSLCAKNYLDEIHTYFTRNKKSNGCSIYFEHPLEGEEFKQEVYEGICNYELHLRYYLQAFRYSGHPYAYHTVGSSFAVRASAYMKQGGMNKRKAGEDFYFIQKIVALGNYGELNSTRVIPSPRPSDRVPFGTGRAILKYMDGKKGDYQSYNLTAFELLRKFFQLIPEFYLNRENPETVLNRVPKEISAFLKPYFILDRLAEFNENTKFINSYTNRFYNWFNAFMVLKFVHFHRDEYGGLKSLNSESNRLLEILGENKQGNNVDLLMAYRSLEQKKASRMTGMPG